MPSTRVFTVFSRHFQWRRAKGIGAGIRHEYSMLEAFARQTRARSGVYEEVTEFPKYQYLDVPASQRAGLSAHTAQALTTRPVSASIPNAICLDHDFLDLMMTTILEHFPLYVMARRTGFSMFAKAPKPSPDYASHQRENISLETASPICMRRDGVANSLAMTIGKTVAALIPFFYR